MTTASITLQRADGADIERIESLLDANGLPSRDVPTAGACFFLAYAYTECIGTGGVEIHGSDGLLRSVLITESHRGQGYGAALCDSLEEHARAKGVETLYLLTTTAAPFFRRCGYDAVAREDVPGPIRDTTEFTDLCPASATCMAKGLEP
jgi:amino-acid N-acetyltransferase